nr:MAG TPA: hypothetical protein [Caudoviricetes sp.]
MLASKEYLDFRINSNDISSLRNINKDFDKILPKIIYENPEKPNGLILDGAYVNDVIKTSGFSSSKSIILNNPDLNKVRKKFGYNHLKIINTNGVDAFIFYDKARSINGWTFDFDSGGLENKLIISNPKYLKNCTFEKNVLIKFEQTNKKLVTYYGEQYGIEKFLDFISSKISGDTCKFNRYYNDNGGILIPKKMVQYLKNIKEWQDLFYNKLTTPYKFVLL